MGQSRHSSVRTIACAVLLAVAFLWVWLALREEPVRAGSVGRVDVDRSTVTGRASPPPASTTPPSASTTRPGGTAAPEEGVGRPPPPFGANLEGLPVFVEGRQLDPMLPIDPEHP